MRQSYRELHRLLAIAIGAVSIVWAVADVLPWMQRIGLVAGVALIAHGQPFIILKDNGSTE